jgi:hypothetical protein
MCMFCRSLFVLLYFFFWPLCCLFFFNIRILITPLVSSNSSIKELHILLTYRKSRYCRFKESRYCMCRLEENPAINIYSKIKQQFSYNFNIQKCTFNQQLRLILNCFYLIVSYLHISMRSGIFIVQDQLLMFVKTPALI